MQNDSPQDQEPIQRQKLSDLVFERLWKMIQTGALAPGDTIPSERALMERFGTGRPAVREALQMLAHKGLITISHGERSKVNELTAEVALGQVDDIAKLLLSSRPANIEHLKQARRILERGTVAIAARECSAHDAEMLRALVQKQRTLLGQDRPFIEADIDFHVAIARITGNPLLETITRTMLTWLFAYYKPMLHWEGRENTTLREHEEIAEHLARHQADNAIRLMEAHLNRSDPLYTSAESEVGLSGRLPDDQAH
ncbi:transcriptional regulator NanR [uncultured Roseovarius sp.]|uniref:transcriptional regulator NanR n=1 Tax=uncultured Roseovarius sp. TaxID=293344 RepID=UPI00262AA949|nr:transcriptional regulator NanR [uncultured Roseovarius sp.]